MVARTYLMAVDIERNEAFSKKRLTGPGCKRDVGGIYREGFKDNAQVAGTNHKKNH